MEKLIQPEAPNEEQETVALKKALEWELSLDSRDLRSHAWYHGPLPRQRAEEIVHKEGDFLIRDCASQPDHFVLTCKMGFAVLHFVINKILLQPETVYERIQYQFEEDAFDTVPDLITFYVGSGKPISAVSGARIQFPCNRTYPLSFYGHKIVGNQLHMQMLSGIRGETPLSSPCFNSSSFRFNTNDQQNKILNSQKSPPRAIPDTLERSSEKQRSQSLTPSQFVSETTKHDGKMFSSSDEIIQQQGNSPQHLTLQPRHLRKRESFSVSGETAPLNSIENCNGFQTIARSTISESVQPVKFTTHSLPRTHVVGLRFHSNKGQQTNRDTIKKPLPECIEINHSREAFDIPPIPPSKPNRPAALLRQEKEFLPHEQHINHRMSTYQGSGSDSGNGSGDSVQNCMINDRGETNQQRGVIIKNPKFLTSSASSATLNNLTEYNLAEEEYILGMEFPLIEPISKFDVENFNTLLLPSVENKPLDSDALSNFKIMLLESGPKILAEHLTRIDIGLIINNNEPESRDLNLNIMQCCGLELITLPRGKAFRCDLLERTQCLKLMVAVSIVTCQTDEDRAKILSKWIQVAVDTKTALGNLFGFCAIMLGLCMPEIQRLENAWHILRQKFTDSAFTFEAKLRPTLKNMNDCTNPQAPNTTVPHVLLYILLKERIIDSILCDVPETNSLVSTCITPLENKADDFGISITFLHLDSSRGFLKNLTLFKKNSKTVLDESNSRLDELLSDAFRTEFHIKFLWGSEGASASPEHRYSKLEKVLALMVDKFGKTVDNSS